MANNRELSQFASFVEVNDTSRYISVASTSGQYVGIGSTLPTVKVDIVGDVKVSGNITATSYYGDGSNLTGIATVGGGTTLGLTTVTQLNVTGITSLSSLVVSGIATFGNIVLNPVGIITAVSGVVTYYGDGSKLTNIISGVGVATAGGTVGTGATILDFRGAGISTVTVSSGIATINVTGGGGGGAVSISSIAPPSPNNGDLWYSIEYGRTFVYYNEVTLGIGSTAVWVDAAPFNINLSQLDPLLVTNLVVSGNTTLNTLSVTGVSTLSSLVVGNVNSTGIITSVLLNTGNINSSGIITSVSLTTGDINSSGIITCTDLNSTSDVNLKENIQTFENALDIVEQLHGVSFNWKKDGRHSIGVIAQELEKVLPELVSDTDPKTVNYNGIIGVLIEAIKDLKKEIENLKSTK